MTDEEAERRLELAMQVSALNERSKQNQRQLDKLDSTLTTHAKDETELFTVIRDSVAIVHEKIEAKVTSAILPVKNEVAELKKELEDTKKEVAELTTFRDKIYGGKVAVTVLISGIAGMSAFIWEVARFFLKLS